MDMRGDIVLGNIFNNLSGYPGILRARYQSDNSRIYSKVTRMSPKCTLSHVLFMNLTLSVCFFAFLNTEWVGGK